MDSWDGPLGPLLKTRSGLSSLVTAASAASDEDEHYERSRKTSTQTRGINAKSRKPKEAAPHYHPYKTTETALASPHGMARRGSITTSFSRTNSAGDFCPSESFIRAPFQKSQRRLSGKEGPLITRTASIARTESSTRSRRGSSRGRASVFDEASMVRAVSGTLEEILAMGARGTGAQGREADRSHETPMRTRPKQTPLQRSECEPEFSRVPSHSYFTRSQSAVMGSFEGHMGNLLMAT